MEVDSVLSADPGASSNAVRPRYPEARRLAPHEGRESFALGVGTFFSGREINEANARRRAHREVVLLDWDQAGIGRVALELRGTHDC